MSKQFQGKSVVITGAGGGIGAATARHFAVNQASVVLVDRVGPALAELSSELSALVPDCAILCCAVDISDRQALRRGLAEVLGPEGRVNILVNNAGIADENLPEQEDIWHRVLNINLHGTYYMSLAALERMPEGGRIVNVASILGRAGQIRNTAYVTSKHAMLGLTKSLAMDVAPRGITVNAVLPAWVDTPMLRGEIAAQAERIGSTPEMMLRNARRKIPLRRLVGSGEVASLIGFLASAEASSITAQGYTIDGGFTCGA